MTTKHILENSDARFLNQIKDKSVQLIVTSPPYPMIEMWDDIFISQDESIADDMKSQRYRSAFLKMHHLLNTVWHECDRVLADNCFVCINVGDATRTLGNNFQLFSNHTQIINTFSEMGYSVLPDIHWRKHSNSPNKFMGSGMYPAGAYVTYEHEYILVFRKGGKRTFTNQDKLIRRESAYFWEERNSWFSDLWDIKGTGQIIKSPASRVRSAAYPFDIPYRLINMYSIKGDFVLDPFSGLGTTTIASMASQRNSIGYELDPTICSVAQQQITKSNKMINEIIQHRLKAHNDFIQSLPDEKSKRCYVNKPHGFLVKTRQEIDLSISFLEELSFDGKEFVCTYIK